MAKHQLEIRKECYLIGVEELQDDDLVVPLAFMGAPLVGIEKIPSGREFIILIQLLEKALGKKATVLMPAEIGGGNAFTPITAACQLGLPVLDADTLGRAFPELQMSVCNLNQISVSPAFFSDSMDNVVMIQAKESSSLESLARSLTIAMGSCSALAMYLMSGTQAKSCVIPGTISQGIAIGKALAEAKERQENPIHAVLETSGGKLLGRGKIMDIQQSVTGGFLKGSVKIQNEQESFLVEYQNEYLAVKKGEKFIATTPDILMLLERDTATPITSESLRYGLNIDLIAIPSPVIWQSTEGLRLVGPRYFGYNVDYYPCNRNQGTTV
jgi:DUF917 family protein